MLRGEAISGMAGVKGLGRFMKGAESLTAASEDLPRMALFEASLAKGLAPERAAERVFRYYYKFGQDFGGPADKALGNIFFFWRWMRQNMVGSGKNFVDHFGKVSAMAKVVKAVEDRVGIQGEEMAPDWLKQRAGIKLFKGAKGPQYLALQGWLPLADIGQLVRPHKYALESLNPFVRVPLEAMSGREFYYDRKISEYPGQRRDVLGQAIDPRLEYAMRQLRIVSEPIRVAKRFQQAEGPAEKAKAAALQFTAGARAYPIDTKKEAANRFFDEIAKITRVKSDIKRAERTGKVKEVERLTRLLEQMSRKSDRYRQVAGIQ